MRLAIDSSRSVDSIQKTGVEVVSDHLLAAMAQALPEGVEPAYYAPAPISWLPAAQQRVIPLRRLWTLVRFTLALLRDRPDALFVPVHTLPLWCPKTVVRAIHDVAFLRNPQAYGLLHRWYLHIDLWRSRRLCRTVLVPAGAVRGDLISLAGFPDEKIVVTGWGASAPPRGWQPKAREQMMLFIGRIEDKKNIANLITAFGIFQKTHPAWTLVLAGKPGHGYERIAPQLSQPGVTALGYVDDAAKWELLSRASALALVSKEEGFAFPMLEAFAAEVPVVASSIPTLHEVGGDACLYANPESPEEIAQMLEKAADNSQLRTQLIAHGSARLGHYRWKDVAAKAWQAILSEAPSA